MVINADDFGYSEQINSVVYDAISRKSISSATIMANGPAVDEAIIMAKHWPNVSFGVHLNLTEFSPLSSPSTLITSCLVDGNQQFLGQGFRQLQPSSQVLEACYQELDQQLLSVHQKGLRPSHFDSHHHIHTIPWLLPVLWRLQQKYKIFRLRNTLNVYSVPPTGFRRYRLMTAKRLWMYASILLGARMTERFSSLQTFLEDPFRPEFVSACSVELMCHPGQFGFEAETEQLLTRGQSLLPEGFRLTNYAEAFDEQ
ncbi:MAG: ChbG/HpnK family deacetylase [Cyanobacteriota bacterium]|nr:ChbG/HpnK family deacetylase [Cyanobacteriota bacterium]